MKKLSILLSALFLLLATGCEKYVTYDDIDPNNPTDVPVATLLSNVEVTIFATFNGQMTRNAGMWSQHFEGTLFQMVEQGSYSISEADVTNDWNTIYTSGIGNALEVIKKGQAQGSPYYTGIGQVCKALLLGIATDYWGDIPNTEAGLGGANLAPHFDAQSDVIADIQTLLSSAISNLSQPASANLIAPGPDDFIHGGDPARWVVTAWILKARYANRISNRNAAGSATAALAAIDAAVAAGMTGNGDDAESQFFDGGGSEYNSWYAFESDRADYIKLSATLTDTMNALSDPRISFYADTNDLGLYDGAALGSEDVTASPIGTYFASPGAPLPLVTYVEARFIEAEAALRAGDGARAQVAYAAALDAALNRYTGIDAIAVAAYLLANGTLTGTPAQMQEQIMFQKWISNFTQPEAWADWRRTNLPPLTPHPNGVTATIPYRYPTEQNERLYNANATVISNSTTPVWWDN